jgi:hypothetical protein
MWHNIFTQYRHRMSLRGDKECSIQHVNHLHTAHMVNMYVVIVIILFAVGFSMIINHRYRR